MYKDNVTFPLRRLILFLSWWLKDVEFDNKLGRFRNDLTNSGSYGFACAIVTADCKVT